jgi:RNA polymerase sigma-70 factor (ECF subfamily)
VFLSCRGFFSNSAAAEDATQETFLRVYQNLHSFQGGSFAGWLMRIARNVCIDQWRKYRPQGTLDQASLPENSAPSAPGDTPELKLMVEEIWKEMGTLPPGQRICLEMKIQGYSYEETAARTGLPIEAVKSHLQNGRRRLWLKAKGIAEIQ